MKNKIIWVDLDEVLSETLDFLLKKNNNKIWEFEIKREEIKDYYIHKMEGLNLSVEQAIEWFQKPMNNDILDLEIEAVEGAVNKLLEFKINWYKIIVVTARIEEKFWEYTKKWLQKYFNNLIDDIIFTDHFTDKHRHKWEVCRELWIEYMIEDNMDYALDLAENWIKTYLLEKPWNNHRTEEHKNLIRIQNWNEFKIK